MDLHFDKGLTYMVVEDNPSQLQAVVDPIVELTGTQPLVASGYHAAVKHLRDHAPQPGDRIKVSDPVIALVVLDQDLSLSEEDLRKFRNIKPVFAGLDLISRAKALAPLAAVGMLTAHRFTERDLGFEAAAAGADFYISKNLRPFQLQEALSPHLQAFGHRVEDYNAGLKG